MEEDAVLRYPISGRDPKHCTTHHICDCLAHKLYELEDQETLQSIQQRVKEWAAHNFPKAMPYQPLLGIAEEVGELVEADGANPESTGSLLGTVAALGRLNHAHLKADQGIRGTPEEHAAKKMDALCNKHGLDFFACVLMAWNEISGRDWQEFPKNGRTE